MGRKRRFVLGPYGLARDALETPGKGKNEILQGLQREHGESHAYVRRLYHYDGVSNILL